MILFDAHVHIHEAFSLDGLLACAQANFLRHLPQDSPLPAAFILFLAESRGCDFFSALGEKIKSDPNTTRQGWRIVSTREEESLLVTHGDLGGRLFILAGRQLVTAEKIEVLALATAARFAEGQALAETVEAVRKHEGLAVLPWGVGKWLGKRRKILGDFLGKAAPGGLFVGDNGGRPSFWPAPGLFHAASIRGIRLLPGSDPLPLAGEEMRVGSYGGFLQGDISDDHPAADLRRLLADRSKVIVPFGNRQGAWQFFRTQLALRRLRYHS